MPRAIIGRIRRSCPHRIRRKRVTSRRGVDFLNTCRSANLSPPPVRRGQDLVPTPASLDRLNADYAKLVERSPAVLTEDQCRSLIFYWWELAARIQKAAPPRTPVRVVQWFPRFGELEDYVRTEAHRPRQNTRSPNGVTPEEKTLATWIRMQRFAADQGRRCDDQMRRLACIPGFHI